MPELAGNVQRSLLFQRGTHIHLGAGIEQHPCDMQPAKLGSSVESSVASRSTRGTGRIVRKQQTDHVGMPFLGGKQQGRMLQRLHSCLQQRRIVLKKQAGDSDMTKVCGVMQRSIAVSCSRVGRHTSSE